METWWCTGSSEVKTLLAEDTMLLYEYVEDKQLYTTFVDENLDNYYEGLWRWRKTNSPAGNTVLFLANNAD